MARPRTLTGWKLARDDRQNLRQHFSARYENVVADHVTLRTGASRMTPLPPKLRSQIAGYADDGKGLECLVVELDGTADRPDGSTYHSIWSLDAEREARESNVVLRKQGCDPIPAPIEVALAPARS